MNIFSKENFEVVQDVILTAKVDQNQNGNHADKAEEMDPHEQSLYIQQLIEEIDDWKDKEASELMQECVHELLSFYGKGLERILDIVGKSSNGSSHHVYNDLISDQFVSSLLLIHDLHPLDLKTRLYMALDKVKPYMDSHGGAVEIVSLENGVARLKFSGNCKGCPSSSSTMELGIRQAVEELCPDLIGLEVEGVLEKTV